MKTAVSHSMIQDLTRLWELCPDMRLGQLMATLGLLVEDKSDRSLWDMEDEDLSVVIEEFRQQLSGRDPSNGQAGTSPPG